MSWTFIACVGVAFAWMGLFYLWGSTFLTIIHAENGLASSVCFGYLVLQVLYQVIYLPFYLTRGSYRALSYTWLGLIVLSSVFLVFFLARKGVRKESLNRGGRVGICIAGVLIISLACYISLHVPFYGQDTVTYISAMNDSYYRDTMWVVYGGTSLHYGMCSMFQFFTTSSLLTGIKPYYISLFTVRVVGICLFSMITYRIGETIFKKTDKDFSWPAVILSVVAPSLLMFWGSMYTAEFFYWRINEAKGFCQFVLLPLGFSVFLSMFERNVDRKPLWKKQVMVGLSAVAISASSLTPYLFLVLMATIALLAYDKLKDGWKTVGWSAICMSINLIYLAMYILEKKGMIVL